MHRRFALALTFVLLSTLLPLSSARAGGTVEERISTYPVSGRTGAELYQSIGQNGPVISGGRRTLAHTSFKLTWRRDYRKKDGGCVLAGAIPKLVITYTLPKPSAKLAPDVAASWKRFIDAIAAHEKVHGDQIRAMTEAIETESVGLFEPGDPGCKRIYGSLEPRLKALSDRRSEQSRAFDAVEMAPGGPIERLILDLVNGP